MVAQALAYSLFLAIPAVVLVALGIFSLVADTSTVEQLSDRLRPVMPQEAITLLQGSLERSTRVARSGRGDDGGRLRACVVDDHLRGLDAHVDHDPGLRPRRPARFCPTSGSSPS